MCSTQWEMPVMPVCSFREPTLYQIQVLTTGAWCDGWIRTLSPLSSRVSCTSAMSARPSEGDGESKTEAAKTANRPSYCPLSQQVDISSIAVRQGQVNA